MVTRRDVARLAGTSEAVVSYVVNDGPRTVSAATRARVLAAVAELGYRPNVVARSLRMQRTMTFGLVVPDAANPYFAELAAVIEDLAVERGYTMLRGNAKGDSAREATYVRALLDRQVDGLIVAPTHGSSTNASELATASVPRLVLDKETSIPDATHILVDNHTGGYAATSHLAAHGRSRIGCLAGPADSAPTAHRVAGWRQALREAELDPAAVPLLHVPSGRSNGHLAGRKLLLDSGAAVDALFVVSDDQAIGVIRAAAELGVRIPDDVALCAFDGVSAAAYTVPGLTTVRQPLDAIGRHAVDWLMAHAEGSGPEATRIVLDTELVTRESCGCPEVSSTSPLT